MQRHPQHHGALGAAEVPGQRRGVRQHERQRARPERLDQVARGLRHLADQAVDRRPRADQHRHGHVRAALLGRQQRGHGRRGERVAADPVHGVGGQHHQPARAHGAGGGGEPRRARRRGRRSRTCRPRGEPRTRPPHGSRHRGVPATRSTVSEPELRRGWARQACLDCAPCTAAPAVPCPGGRSRTPWCAHAHGRPVREHEGVRGRAAGGGEAGAAGQVGVVLDLGQDLRRRSSAGTASPWVSSCSMPSAPPWRSRPAAAATTARTISSPSGPPNTATRRVPRRDLGRHRRAVGDVGRVAQDEVDVRLQLGEQVGPAHVRGVQGDRGAAPRRERRALRRAHISARRGRPRRRAPRRPAERTRRPDASAPEPVHRSTTSGDGTSGDGASPHSSSSSVSGRGVNTPGPTATSTGPSTAVPSRCCSGSRAARRSTSARSGVDGGASTQRGAAAAARAAPSDVGGEQLGVDARRGDPGGGQHRSASAIASRSGCRRPGRAIDCSPASAAATTSAEARSVPRNDVGCDRAEKSTTRGRASPRSGDEGAGRRSSTRHGLGPVGRGTGRRARRRGRRRAPRSGCRPCSRPGGRRCGSPGSCRCGCARSGRPCAPANGGPPTPCAAASASASACSRDRSTSIARARFCSCERSFWQLTTMPVGRWVIRTAESVVLTLCPPWPDERNTSMRRSFSSISTRGVLADVRVDEHAGRATCGCVPATR